MCRSVPQTLAVSTSTSTSPAAGTGTGISSSRSPGSLADLRSAIIVSATGAIMPIPEGALRVSTETGRGRQRLAWAHAGSPPQPVRAVRRGRPGRRRDRRSADRRQPDRRLERQAGLTAADHDGRPLTVQADASCGPCRRRRDAEALPRDPAEAQRARQPECPGDDGRVRRSSVSVLPGVHDRCLAHRHRAVRPAGEGETRLLGHALHRPGFGEGIARRLRRRPAGEALAVHRPALPQPGGREFRLGARRPPARRGDVAPSRPASAPPRHEVGRGRHRPRRVRPAGRRREGQLDSHLLRGQDGRDTGADEREVADAGRLPAHARLAVEMSDRQLRAWIAALALAGAAVAAYLVYARYSGVRLACTTGGCETVQHSKYAKAAGIPVAVLGLAAYLAVFATTFSARVEAAAIGAAIV